MKEIYNAQKLKKIRTKEIGELNKKKGIPKKYKKMQEI